MSITDRNTAQTNIKALKRVGAKPGVKVTTQKSVECKKLICRYSRDFEGTLGNVEVTKSRK